MRWSVVASRGAGPSSFITISPSAFSSFTTWLTIAARNVRATMSRFGGPSMTACASAVSPTVLIALICPFGPISLQKRSQVISFRPGAFAAADVTMTMSTWPLPSSAERVLRSGVRRAAMWSATTRSPPCVETTFVVKSTLFSLRRKTPSCALRFIGRAPPSARSLRGGAFLRLEVHRQLARLGGLHRGVDFLEEVQHLRLHVEVERAAAADPAVDAEVHRDVVREVVAVELDLRGGDLDAVARHDLHAALRLRLLRVAVELRLRADELVREAGGAVDGELHVFERVPAGLEADDAPRPDARDDAAADGLRVLERLRLAARLVEGARRRRDAAPGDVVFPGASAAPVQGDVDDEGNAGDRKRDAQDADRPLHAPRNSLLLKRIPRVDEVHAHARRGEFVGLEVEEDVAARADERSEERLRGGPDHGGGAAAAVAQEELAAVVGEGPL